MYINIERYLDRIAAMLILLEDKFSFNITAIKFYPLINTPKIKLYEKACVLGEAYPVIKPEDFSEQALNDDNKSSKNNRFFKTEPNKSMPTGTENSGVELTSRSANG